MRSFRKMAKEKKIKVLTFVVFLCALNWFCEVKAAVVPKLMHIIRDGQHGLEGVCIASEEDAFLATDWTYPIQEGHQSQPQIDTYFLPNLTSDFDCNFEKGQHCAESWISNVWRVPEESNKNYETIFDYRWEDFKVHLITKDTPMVARRIDIRQYFNITLSIRSDHSAQIWLCEGWLPEKHACYTILLGSEDGKSLILKKSKNNTLASYVYEDHTLSFDQWKSFRLSLSESGTMSIVDLTKNFDVTIFPDESPLKPIFLFMNSDMPSLWKIHQNNFLYTNVSAETAFGPTINMTNKYACVSMFADMCEGCRITFYSEINGKRNVLLHTNGTADVNTWTQFKIHVNNYTQDQLQLFIKTEGPQGAYWMIDNVRRCTPSEVKVKVLKNGNISSFNITGDEISCHRLLMQQWRPKPFRMKPDIGSPQIIKQAFNTSVKLSWKPLWIYDIELPFILGYEGHHLCGSKFTLRNASLERIKSNAIALARGSTVIIDNLVPYTHYMFTLIHPIYEVLTKKFEVNTNETENITEFERPSDVHLLVTSTSVTLNHAQSCNDLYGHIVYEYSIHNTSSKITQDTVYMYYGLKPFTNYTLRIGTARNLSGLKSSDRRYDSYYNFTTKPGVANPVGYLDVFEKTENSISLRYSLPNITTGIPEFVCVTYCNWLIKYKCSTVIENITKCAQYPDMYCIRVVKLIRNEGYTFRLSVKNKGTHRNGESTNVMDFAKSSVPGKVSNITYTVLSCSEVHEYCHFNVSWSHPWNQNGDITAFEIELVEVRTTKGLDDIHVIKDGEYKPRYSHLVRYLPYATTYNISVRAINENFKGNYTTIQGKIDHIGEHIDQIPYIVKVSPYNLVVEIPILDVRIEKAVLTVIVQSMVLQHIDTEMWKISNGSLCRKVAETWIAKVLEFSILKDVTFMIGDDTTQFSKIYNRSITNKRLLPDSDYCLTYVVQNTYKNITHTKVYHWQEMTLPVPPEAQKLSSGIFNVVITLLSLVVLLVVALLILYRYRRNLYCRKVRQDGEHIYEAMPFEDYNEVPNVVYNVTYDKLVHD